MLLHFDMPPWPLAEYINLITYYRGYDPAHSVERLVPDGCVTLILDLQEYPKYIFDNETLQPRQHYVKAWVSGMQTGFISISAGKQAEMLVISFRPGGAYPFLGLPLMELKDQVVDADLVLGQEIHALREQILAKDTPEAKCQLARPWLRSKLRERCLPEKVIHYSISCLTQGQGPQTLASLADKTGYSHKQFIHLFKKHIGLRPKYFQRVVRFNQALQAIHQQTQIDWMGIAIDCGYYDQAHFIRDFRHFSGLNPRQYLEAQGAYANYLPLR